jgi:hypothetical protein
MELFAAAPGWEPAIPDDDGQGVDCFNRDVDHGSPHTAGRRMPLNATGCSVRRLKREIKKDN